MPDKKELNKEQLEKVNGGRGETRQWSVIYTTDGKTPSFSNGFGDNGESSRTNTRYHYLGWFKNQDGAISAGQDWCNQNGKYYAGVTQGEHESQ